MQAFHGKQEVKDKYLNRVKAHRAADELIKSVGWQDGKGCAIGCTLENYDHSRYPIELGIPLVLARLEDCIFEGLTNGNAQAWPERFLAAIKPGADLTLVWPKFALWLLTEELEPHLTDTVRPAVQGVSDLWTAVIEGLEVPEAEWRSAAAAAGWVRMAAAAAAAAAGWQIN